MGESFTEVIKRAVGNLKRKPLSSFAGRWAGSPKELDSILAGIKRMWAEYDERLGLRESPCGLSRHCSQGTQNTFQG